MSKYLTSLLVIVLSKSSKATYICGNKNCTLEKYCCYNDLKCCQTDESSIDVFISFGEF
jgi:hypothetical protein